MQVSEEQKQVFAIDFKGALPPLSIYVHIPWCVKKCPYCDFNSHVFSQEPSLPEHIETQYLQALEADILQMKDWVKGRLVQTVFIGGGTPSLLSSHALDTLMQLLSQHFSMAVDVEVTMEANPSSVELSRFVHYAQSGVTRFSLGVQSFQDEYLRQLGRVHTAKEACQGIEVAYRYVNELNIDLMYALPGQTLEKAYDDISQAMSYQTTHLSLYHLTMEPNTLFGHSPPKNLPDDEVAMDIQDLVIQQAIEGGFEQYEVSAYAKAGHRCRHNLNYWQFGDYVGIGAGAHGKISFSNKILRTATKRSPKHYTAHALKKDRSHYDIFSLVKPSDLSFEFMLNVLRLKEGVPTELFEQYTGCTPDIMAPQLKMARQKGLLVADLTRYQASELGWSFLNDLQSCFL
ncbi:MAG: radical SAM family heme chaperone HemW [Alcaligenaceae bacterium]|nr:radical SAM family heme chaperone HemW [Alcaligenaceae bacterium]